jgi:hypothetical protein
MTLRAPVILRLSYTGQCSKKATDLTNHGMVMYNSFRGNDEQNKGKT